MKGCKKIICRGPEGPIGPQGIPGPTGPTGTNTLIGLYDVETDFEVIGDTVPIRIDNFNTLYENTSFIEYFNNGNFAEGTDAASVAGKSLIFKLYYKNMTVTGPLGQGSSIELNDGFPEDMLDLGGLDQKLWSLGMKFKTVMQGTPGFVHRFICTAITNNFTLHAAPFEKGLLEIYLSP